jgi:hypothetical protein
VYLTYVLPLFIAILMFLRGVSTWFWTEQAGSWYPITRVYRTLKFQSSLSQISHTPNDLQWGSCFGNIPKHSQTFVSHVDPECLSETLYIKPGQGLLRQYALGRWDAGFADPVLRAVHSLSALILKVLRLTRRGHSSGTSMAEQSRNT